METTAFDRRDLVVGTVIALVMAGVFVSIGGKPLLVTFIPGLIVTWGVYVWMCRGGAPVPSLEATYPIYHAALAWQFIHFFEEFSTGFNDGFPAMYGSPAYGPVLFVGINMFSYFVFMLTFVGVFRGGLRFLLVPVLFFAIYGAMGNAIAHMVWAVMRGGYFPGLFTAAVYWILGPILLVRLVGGARTTLIVIALFAVVLIPTLVLTAAPM